LVVSPNISRPAPRRNLSVPRGTQLEVRGEICTEHLDPYANYCADRSVVIDSLSLRLPTARVTDAPNRNRVSGPGERRSGGPITPPALNAAGGLPESDVDAGGARSVVASHFFDETTTLENA